MLRAGKDTVSYDRQGTHSTRENGNAHEGRNKLLDILVGDEGAERGERGAGGLLDVRLGVPDGIDHDGDDVGHKAGALLRGRDDELVHDGEGASLDLPLAGGLDLLEQDGQEDGDGPRGRDLDDRADGLDGSLADVLLLVGKRLGDDRLHDLFVEERLDGVADALLDEDPEQVARGLADAGILLVGETLEDRVGNVVLDERVGSVELDVVDELLDGVDAARTVGGTRQDGGNVEFDVGRRRDLAVVELDVLSRDLGSGRGRHGS